MQYLYGLCILCLLWACRSGSAEQPILVDMHNDVLSGTVMQGFDISHRLDTGNTDLVRLGEGGVDLQIFSAFGPQQYSGARGFELINRQIDSLYAIASRNPDKLEMAPTVKQALSIIGTGKMAGMIGVEGGHLIDGKLKYLDSLKKRGVVYLTLTWNNSTAWASSAVEESDPGYTGHKGLSDFGRRVVQRMNKLGMAVDLAHVGPKTFQDALEVSTRPVLVSHGNARALCDVPRNLTDAQIRAVAESGGVIGVSFYAGFLDENYTRRIQAAMEKQPLLLDSLRQLGYETQDRLMAAFLAEKPLLADSLKVPITTLVDHIDHIVKIAGIDHVGLGGDYYGLTRIPFARGLEDVRGYPILEKALADRGYTTADIRKIFGENVLRVLQEIQQ